MLPTTSRVCISLSYAEPPIYPSLSLFLSLTPPTNINKYNTLISKLIIFLTSVICSITVGLKTDRNMT